MKNYKRANLNPKGGSPSEPVNIMYSPLEHVNIGKPRKLNLEVCAVPLTTNVIVHS